MDDDLPRFLTVKETGEALRISTSSVYEAIQRDEIKAIRVGSQLRIPRSEITSRQAEERIPHADLVRRIAELEDQNARLRGALQIIRGALDVV